MTNSIPSISVSYARSGSSTKANALGMRPMQERAYERRGEQCVLIKSPPASGKSRALMSSPPTSSKPGLPPGDHRRPGEIDRREL